MVREPGLTWYGVTWLQQQKPPATAALKGQFGCVLTLGKPVTVQCMLLHFWGDVWYRTRHVWAHEGRSAKDVPAPPSDTSSRDSRSKRGRDTYTSYADTRQVPKVKVGTQAANGRCINLQRDIPSAREGDGRLRGLATITTLVLQSAPPISPWRFHDWICCIFSIHQNG